MDYEQLVTAIDSASQALLSRAANAVNQALVVRNWLIGAHLLEFEQSGQDRATYGERLLSNLAGDLKARGLKGLGISMLKNCRQFYRLYPGIRQSIRPFSHRDAGQMNFYLNYFKQKIMATEDNPPVGVILCSDKDQTKVQFATAGLDNQLFVSRYLVALPSADALRKIRREDPQPVTVGLHQTMATAVLVAFCHFLRSRAASWR